MTGLDSIERRALVAILGGVALLLVLGSVAWLAAAHRGAVCVDLRVGNKGGLRCGEFRPIHINKEPS